MAEFKITNSKVDQLNETGDNVKITGNSGQVVVAGSDANQVAGEKNTIQGGGPSLLKKAWNWAKKMLGWTT